MATKSLTSLHSAFESSQHEDDEDADAAEYPEMTRNQRVLALKGIFELFEEILDDPDEEDEETEDEELASVIKKQNRRREVARDKRMSTFYKAFMGDMRNLVNPWHGNRAKFLELWAEMGNNLYSNSPAKRDKKTVTITVVETDEVNEEASVIGSEAALPSKVYRELAELGFTPVPQPASGDAAWMKSGTKEGYPDRQVYLIRREEGSYLILLSKNDKYQTYGSPLKKQLLDESATDADILRVLAFMYDAMANQ